MLDFQLATHEKYIKKFVMLFKKLDEDTNGIVNEDEFKRLIAMIKVAANEDETDRLLQIIDPYNNQQITFSECLALLSSVITRSESIVGECKCGNERSNWKDRNKDHVLAREIRHGRS